MIFRNWVLENFPFLEDDFDALTDYELFCKMLEYVKTIVKNDEDFNKRLTDLENYINNLDLQDEVNNKLDEMAESGELTDIIAQYLQLAGVLAFNTLNDLVNATNIVNGSICRTLGESTYNDGKGSYYKIRTITSGDVIDGVNIVALNISNTLIAEKIIEYNSNDSKNVLYYGADPTGTIDSSNAIQQCLDNNINKEVVFTCGTYKIEHPIEISYNNQYGGINFNNSIIIDETNGDFSIGVGTKNHNLEHSNSNDIENRFYNITNLKMRTNSTYGILIDRWFQNVRIDNIDIYCYKNGIQIGKNYTNYDTTPSDAQISNFILTCNDMTQNYEGITIIGTDNKISDGRIYGFKTCINANQNLLEIDNIHFLATNFNNAILNNDYICIKNANSLYTNMCYCDSYPCFIKPNGNNCSIFITNLTILSWHSNFSECSLFDFSDLSTNVIPSLMFENIELIKSNYINNLKIIELSSNDYNNTCILNSFNSENNIVIRGVYEFNELYKDLSLSKKGLYTNHYWSEWLANWIPMGYLNITNNGLAFINIIDNDLGILNFRVEIINKRINSCKKIAGISEYNPSLAFKYISDNTYKIYYAKDKTDLTVTTYTDNPIELVKTSICYITPITLDLFNENAISETTVDIISN